MLTRNSQIETRRAPANVTPKSFDVKARTFEAIVSTGAAVKRQDSRGHYSEVLNLSSIDPASLAGIPVLIDHNPDFQSHVGTITAARFENGNLVASIKLTSDSSADAVSQKIADGVLNSMSLGYSVGKWTETNVNGQRVRTAGEIKVVESSLVSTPADSGAKIRKAESMSQEIIETKPIVPDAGLIAHRASVRDIAKRSGLEPSWADSQIDSGVAIENVKAEAHDAMVARSQKISVRQVGASSDDPTVVFERRVDGLLANTTGQSPKPEAREFASFKLSDHVREMMAEKGISTRGMGNDELHKRAFETVSDYPALLSSLGNRMLLPAYQAAETPLKKLFRKASHNDFRQNNQLRISELGILDKLNEAGEIKRKSRTEVTQGYALETYANNMAISRKALINDDLGALRDSSQAWGVATAQTEAKLMVALLEANSNTYDGVALFHATHGNLMTGSGFAAIDLSTARSSLRRTKGLDGKTPINAAPKFLVVPSNLETNAESLLASIYATTSADVNIFAGKLELLVDSRLAESGSAATPTSPWYVFADTALLPCFEYAQLSGKEGPTIETDTVFDQLGIQVRCYYDFAVANLDWRGAVKKAGA